MYNISDRLKHLRKEIGFNNQAEFSEVVNIPLSTLQRYEQGKMKMPHTFLEILSKNFKLTFIYFVL